MTVFRSRLVGLGFLLFIIGQSVAAAGQAVTQDELIERLSDPNPQVRSAAAEQLGAEPFSDGTRALVQHFEDGEEDVEVKLAIIEALRQIRGRRAFGGLARCFTWETNEDVLIPAIHAAAEFDEIRYRGRIMIREFKEQHSDRYRQEILKALGKVDTRESTRFLSKLVESDEESETLIMTAVDSLLRLGVEDAVTGMVELYRTTERQEIKTAILDGVKHLDTAMQASVLTEFVGQESDPRLRVRLLQSISKMRQPGAVQAVLPLLEEDDVESLVHAVYTLGELGDPRAAQPIVRAFERTHEQFHQSLKPVQRVQWEATVLRALQSTAPSEGIEVFKELATHATAIKAESTGQRRMVAEALADQTRIRALAALAETRDPTVAQWIVQQGFMRSEDMRLRIETARVLGALGNQAVVPTLSALAADEMPQVRWNVAAALGSLGGDAAVATLSTMLNDWHHEVVIQALLALGRSPSPSVAEMLRQTSSTHTNERVKHVADQLLRGMGGNRVSVRRGLKLKDYAAS